MTFIYLNRGHLLSKKDGLDPEEESLSATKTEMEEYVCCLTRHFKKIMHKLMRSNFGAVGLCCYKKNKISMLREVAAKIKCKHEQLRKAIMRNIEVRSAHVDERADTTPFTTGGFRKF